MFAARKHSNFSIKLVFFHQSKTEKKKKDTLTERRNNCHEKQNGTSEPHVARTFLDAHNATSLTRHAFKRSYRVARPLAWLWVFLVRDFAFQTFSLSLSFSLRHRSDSHLALCASRDRPATAHNTTWMLRAVQRDACTMAIRSTTSRIVHGWRHSSEIGVDCRESRANPRSYHRETLLQIPFFLLLYRTIRLLVGGNYLTT